MIKKIRKLPWFKIIVVILLGLILYQLIETKNLAKKAYREAQNAYTSAQNAEDYSAEASEKIFDVEKKIKDICLQVGAPCSIF